MKTAYVRFGFKITIALFTLLGSLASSRIATAYPDDASSDERKALDELASEVEGAMIYTRRGRIKKITIGQWETEDLGEGDFVRWGPLGERIAVLHDSNVYVMNADGSDRKRLVNGGVNGGDGCQIEFHTNGHEILYGTRDDQVWAVDIHSGDKRNLDLPWDTEFNISGDGKHLVGRRGDCFLVELPGNRVRKYAGGCSPCVSPDGTLMSSNNGGHRDMDIRKWNGDKLFEIQARNMSPDRRWDNMHWSNHNDFIAMEGDEKVGESYAFDIRKNKGVRLSWDGRTAYPDLFISKDLRTGENPRVMTLAWAAANGGSRAVAQARAPETRIEERPSRDSSERASKLRQFTGGPTRVVWAQATRDTDDLCALSENFRLVGYCTEDGKGERVIRSEVTSYAKPIFSPDGNRLVYSDRSNNRMYVINWDGSGHKEIGRGYASDLWRDPATGIVWLYYRAGDGQQNGGVMRQQLDNPDKREKVWDKTPTGHKSVPWFRLSADGTTVASAFPYSSCGVADLASGKWEKYGNGCWASMAPDNSYRYFNFHGSHQEIGFFDAGKEHYRKINVAGGPGVEGRHKVYHPRWSNDVRFLTVTGPKASERSEILLGRFNGGYTKVEDWVQISRNDKPDYYGDAWIQSGWLAKLNQEPSRMLAQPAEEPARPEVRVDFARHSEWPGDQTDLVYLWENNNATNQILTANNEAGRLCRAVARGRAVFGRFYEMDLGGGAVVAEETDEALLEACKASGELTLEATITPGNVTQGGPARIVTFSEGSGARNFTLGQEGATVLLRLRTPNTGEQGSNPQTDLFEVEAGRTYHVVVSYRPGSLSCYVDGKRVLETDRVSGDFSNWEPMHLLFGDEWDGGRDWSGKLEGVAIYSRAVSEAEARHKHRLYAQRLADREPINRLIVRGELKEITPTPTVEDLQEYSRGLVIYSYEIRDVLEGREEAKKIQVAHWALLDREKLPQIGDRKVGQVYDLQLENFDRHPQLEAERSFNDCEDFDIPLYYDIAGRGVEASPTMLAYEAAPETPKLHLRVNCAGPSMDGWESDDKYVAREERGDEFRFKRTADVSAVPDPAPVDVYKTVRHRNHRYRFDVPDGEYLVRLHFTDDFDPEGEIRRMDFVIENERALKEFNVVKAAGGVGRAVVREIPVRVADGNGLEIKGEDRTGGDVFAAGIEIVSRN